MVRRLPPWSHARTLPHAPERYVAPAQLYCSRLDEKYLSLPTGGHGFLRPGQLIPFYPVNSVKSGGLRASTEGGGPVRFR